MEARTEMSKIKETVKLETTVEIPSKTLDEWEKFISSEFVNYDDEGLTELACVWSETAKFPDGFEVDIKVCTNEREDGDLWSEAVLFNENGNQYAMTECCYWLRGEWELEWFDHKTGIMHIYNVTVKDKTE